MCMVVVVLHGYHFSMKLRAYRRWTEQNRAKLIDALRAEAVPGQKLNRIPSPTAKAASSAGRSPLLQAANTALMSGKSVLHAEVSEDRRVLGFVVACPGRRLEGARHIDVYLGMEAEFPRRRRVGSLLARGKAMLQGRATIEGHGIVAQNLQELLAGCRPETVRIFPSGQPADPLDQVSYALQTLSLAGYLDLQKNTHTEVDVSKILGSSDKRRALREYGIVEAAQKLPRTNITGAGDIGVGHRSR
jgi:hypothetical protein